MPSNPAIELQGLTKVYHPNIRALDGINLRIETGSLVGLLGPNGSGKTTTVKILSGLIRSFGGAASMQGLGLPSRRAAPLLGYMPQQNALYGELSVFENLDFFASINGMRSGIERKKRIDELLALLDLGEKKKSTVDSLSGGMRQRVSLGCALIHRPRVLLLDEPTVGLDPELRAAFWSYFKDEASRGTTILICTHAFDEVKNCSHLAFLRSGKLLRYGPAAELKAEAGTDDWEDIYMAQAGKAESAKGGRA